MEAVRVLDATTQEELAAAAEALDPRATSELGPITQRALAGSREAARAYARIASRYVDEMITTMGVPAGTPETAGIRSVLLARSIDAPLTGWAGHFGLGRGVVAAIASSAREFEGGAIAAPSGWNPEVLASDVSGFQHRVLAELRGSDDPLVQIGRELELSQSDLGSLFGVTRQAISQWLERGVPSDRLADVASVLAVVRVLVRKLKAGRAAMVARRPAPALGGATLLEALAKDPTGTEQLVEQAFDWSATA
jgi:DNA-binding XRE family transcriptional regulator